MSGKTAISWTEATWNPVTGCSRVSDGCRNCYAEALSLRYGWSKKPWTHVNAAENVVLHPERLDAPLHWRKPRRIFVNSMSDLFHEQVPYSYINEVWLRMRNAKQHTYQILTKRPERMLAWTNGKAHAMGWPEREVWPSWVWIGTSVENQREADLRIPFLLDTPTSGFRFLSCEPLLGPLNLIDGLNVDGRGMVDWVICGGESGPKHRPMELDWARSIRDQCQEAGVAFFFKQGSGPRPGMHRELDGRLWERYPGD